MSPYNIKLSEHVLECSDDVNDNELNTSKLNLDSMLWGENHSELYSTADTDNAFQFYLLGCPHEMLSSWTIIHNYLCTNGLSVLIDLKKFKSVQTLVSLICMSWVKLTLTCIQMLVTFLVAGICPWSFQFPSTVHKVKHLVRKIVSLS